MLEAVVDDPERAFEDLRSLLFDVTRALADCKDSGAAYTVLERFAAHRFEWLLHHFQLSAWVLYARACTLSLRSSSELCMNSMAICAGLR